MLILEFCAGSNLSILFVFWFSIFFPTLTHSLCRPDYVGSWQRSPSLLSYSDIGPAPLSSSPPSLFEKFETKTETKTFTVDIEAPSESEHGGEKREDATRKPSLSFRIPERISLSGDYSESIYSSGHIFRFCISVHCPPKIGHSSLLVLLYGQ